MPTLTKLIEMSSKAINSLGLLINPTIIFDVFESSFFKTSLSLGFKENNADSEEVVTAAKNNRPTITNKYMVSVVVH
ncbi:MAG: hypothetical protein RIQ90_479 [Bacteroidota bacterium]